MRSSPGGCVLCEEDGPLVALHDGRGVHEGCLGRLTDQRQEIQVLIDKANATLLAEQGSQSWVGSLWGRLTGSAGKSSNQAATIEGLNRIIENLVAAGQEIARELTGLFDYFPTYPPDWEARRAAVAQRDGLRCSACGSQRELHLHHVLPLGQGGSNVLANLRLLCRLCHEAEHGGRRFRDSERREDAPSAVSERAALIQEAIRLQRRIQFRYRKPEDSEAKLRTVKPDALKQLPRLHDEESTLCVTGFCELRLAPRTFALKRMTGLRVL